VIQTVQNPGDPGQYITRVVVDSDGVSHDIKEVQWPDKIGALTGQVSHTCLICGFDYKASDIKMISGAPYCIPNGCYRDFLGPK
jgi:hypothetical protein